MTHYSVAIRTLALNPPLLKRELESIFAQTFRPQKVVIYIAEGYEAPDFRVADEVYVSVAKGMVAQRAVAYSEIDTPLVLLLDDDVILAPDSAEKLIQALNDGVYDCISADTFATHRLPAKTKIFAAITNLTLPHRDQRYAFKMRANGSFSYIFTPQSEVMPSQTAAGPCCLWRKSALLRLRFADEVWLDKLGFAYNDDGLESYKLYANGGRLAVHFSSGVVNADAKTSSRDYRCDSARFALRAKAVYLVWHRSMLRPDASFWAKMVRRSAFWTKFLLCLPAHFVAAVQYRQIGIPYQYVEGTLQGMAESKQKWYKDLPSYIV